MAISMAFMCLALLIGVVKGQPHNPYYSIFDKGQANRAPSLSDENLNTPSLKALFFMQSPIDHTHVKPPGERTGNQKLGQTAGELSPDLPPGLSKLFPAFTQTESPTYQVPKTDHKPTAGPENSFKGKVTEVDHEASGPQEPTGALEKHKQLIQSNSDSLGLPGMFATSLSNPQPDRKIRRYRSRNHHRKTNQRQGAHGTFNNGTAAGLRETNRKTKTIANQHFKFLSESPSSRETPTSSEINRSSSLTQLEEIYAAKGNGQVPNPGHGIRRQRRQKRGTSLPAQASPHGETFYYRQPDGHSGAVLRTRNHAETRQDPLVRSLEIEEEEDEVGEEEDEEEDDLGISAPPADLPIKKRASAESPNPGDVEELEGDTDKETPATSPDAAIEEPADVEQKDEPAKAVDGSLSSSALSDNTTVNETLARQMFRSPMLVDYGSRVKPQDIITPTESDLEEDMLPETGVEEEPDPLWSEGGDTDDDISLKAEDPKVEDPPILPEVEPETETEPEQQEIIESRIELPIIPLQTANLDPQPEEDAMEEDSPEPESEAEPEGETEPEAESQPLPTSEAEAEGESEPEQEEGSGGGSAHAEPQPEWEDAKKMWGPWWEIHIYGIGMAFAVLAIYSFVSILRLWRKKNLLSQGYFIALNAIMFIMGFIRALYFLVDGYNSNQSFSLAGHYFLYSIGFPCLTSAFSILLLALLQTLKMQILSPKVQRTRVVIGMIAGHFILSVTTDVIVGYLSSAKIMLFVCQLTTVLWGLFLFFGYIYVFRKLYKAAMWRQNEMMRLSLAKFKLDGISPITKAPRLTLNMAVKITLATAIFGLILAGLQTYGMVGVFSVFSTEDPHPWTWLAFKTGMRLTELAMCITMSYVATQPFRYNRGGKGGDHQQSSSCFSGFIYMAPCRRIFECDSATLHDDDLSWNDLPITRETCQMDDNGAHVISEEATPMTASGRAAQAVAAAVVHNQNEREGSTSSKRSSKMAARPASLLVSDNGFIRFREDGEMGGSPVLLSTDDELENISGDNMIRNPFYRDLLRRQEKDRAVGRATFVNSDGITLQDEFGLVENFADPELVPPPRAAYPVKGSFRGFSYPNTGTNTPGTPRSFCSTDLEYAASEISYRPPSSIHLRDSIENALNIPGFTLRTPDMLDSPLHAAYLRTRRGSLFGNRIGARPMGTGSMSDLESLRHYGPGSRYGDSEDTEDVFSHDRAASPDSMYSYTLSNLTRAPLVRSYSDSIGKSSHVDVSVPNSPERRFYKDRLRASMMRNLPENANQFQNLLKNINEMCNVYNKLSPDDREGDE